MSSFDLSIGAPGNPEVLVEADELDDDVAGDAAEVATAAPALVTEAQVRDLLPQVGRFLNGGAGLLGQLDPDLPHQWEFTDDEVDALAPPLTRYINRRPRLQKAVHASDGAVIAAELGGYLTRNLMEGAAARSARENEGTLDGHLRGQAGRDRPRGARSARREARRAAAGGAEDAATGAAPSAHVGD